MQKTNKLVNCDSIQPKTKPSLVHKSDHLERMRNIDYTQISEKRNYRFQDSIRETTQITGHNNSFFRQNLYSNDQDLASSFSFSEQDNEYQYEKLLFSKFLLSKSTNWIAFLHDMNKIGQDKLLTFVKIGQTDSPIKNNRIIAHYIAVWLQSMGYKEAETRKKIIMNLQYIFPDEQGIGDIAGTLFDNLFQGYLPQVLQLKILIQICKRGWEYLSFFLGRFIKLLRKYKNIGEQAFLKEVDKII